MGRKKSGAKLAALCCVQHCLGSRNAEINQRQIIIRIGTQRPTIEKPPRHHPPRIHLIVEKMRRRRTGPCGMPTEKPFASPNDWFNLFRRGPAFWNFSRDQLCPPSAPAIGPTIPIEQHLYAIYPREDDVAEGFWWPARLCCGDITESDGIIESVSKTQEFSK